MLRFVSKSDLVHSQIILDDSMHLGADGISGYYRSTDPQVSGTLKVRDWLKTQSFQKQHAFGVKTLRRLGAIYQ